MTEKNLTYDNRNKNQVKQQTKSTYKTRAQGQGSAGRTCWSR